MFDLGFWELALVTVVALVVIGPERLPHMMRTTGLWLGRLRGMALTVRSELEQELYSKDSTGQNVNKASFDEVKQIIDETGSEISSIGHQLKEVGTNLLDQEVSPESDVSKHDK